MKNQTRRRRGNKKHNKTYRKKDFNSGDGMLVNVWGPPLWHYLHIMSFNYPVKPSIKDKKHYRRFILNLKNVLPCGYCRKNLKKNLKMLPLNNAALKNRETFSKWVFNLHELVNTMLGKKSGLKFCDVRERYEHFRSRCTQKNKTVSNKLLKKQVNKTKKEKGCTEPLYGSKSRCLLKIVPAEKKAPSLQIDKKCIKKRIL
jgi:hypothetical protein